MLGLRATPPEIAPGEEVVLDALVHWPDATPTLVYLVCIPDVGDSLTSCVMNRFSGDQPPPMCSADPAARLCLAGLGDVGRYTLPEGFFPDDGEPHTFFVTALATPGVEGLAECSETLMTGRPSSTCLMGLKRVSVSFAASRNVNPEVAALTVSGETADASVVFPLALGGVAADAFSLALAVQADVDTVDELAGATEPFDLVVSWFTDCGSVSASQGFLPCTPGEGCAPAAITWKPRTSGECAVHAVLRDARGGIGWRSQRFLIQ
jgi:hypothetical protein